MKQSRKGQQWYFSMKCHIGVGIESCLVHTVKGTSGAVNDVVEANNLLRESDRQFYPDAGDQRVGKRPDAKEGVNWNIAMRPGKPRMLDKIKPIEAPTDELERVKAGVRARVEHPFRVVKLQFGHAKVRYRGLAKNTAQLHTLFALANLWLVRLKLIGAMARVRLHPGKWSSPPPIPRPQASRIARISGHRHQIPIGSAHCQARAGFVQTFPSTQ